MGDLHPGRLRMLSAQAFVEDPLRTLRIARLAYELSLAIDPESTTAARAGSAALDRTAPERIFAELKRVVIADRALDGLALMDTLGVSLACCRSRVIYAAPSTATITISTCRAHARRLAATIELDARAPAVSRRACPCGYTAVLRAAGQRGHRGQPLRLVTLFHNVTSRGPATSRRTAGSHSSATEKTGGRRPAPGRHCR